MGGLVTMKAIMELRKVEIREEEEAAEAKQTAEREVRIRKGRVELLLLILGFELYIKY